MPGPPPGRYDVGRYDASVYDTTAPPAPAATYLGNRVPIPVADIDAALVNFDTIRVERGPSVHGPWTMVYTTPLVERQTAYEYRDANATSAAWWYRWSLYSTITGNISQASPAVAGHTAPLLTLGDLRRRVADALGCLGRPRGGAPIDTPYVTTAGGTALVVHCSAFATTRAPQTAWRDWELYLPAGASGRGGPESHPVDTFAGTATDGVFTLGQAASAAVGVGVELELYAERTVFWWNERVNDGLLDLWRECVWPIAGVKNRTEYPLPHWFEDARQALSLTLQTGRTPGEHLYTEGIPFAMRSGEGGGVAVYLPAGMAENAVGLVEGFRHPDPLYADSDILVAPQEQLQYLVWRAARDAAERFRRDSRSAGTLQLWQARFGAVDEQFEKWRRRATTWTRGRSPRQGAMVQSMGRLATQV